MSKKRKIDYEKDSKCMIKMIKIIEMKADPVLFLVEWNDQTRSWEKYGKIKDLDIFQDFLIKNYKRKNLPCYIN